MRLLDTKTGQFVEKVPEKTEYAILSHTWDTEKPEQTYEQLREIQQRYDPAQRRRIVPKGGTSSSPDSNRDRCGSSQPLSPHPPSDSSSLMTRPPRALGRLTQSEAEGLFREFLEVYGLTHPTFTPASSDHPAPAAESQATKRPQPELIWDDPELSPKIRDACKVTRENGYDYIWIDSCCINKSSSSELSEAINSMYKWYSLAEVCYAYLADVPPEDDHHAEDSNFRESRWFTRGWTLQELIAPGRVEFLSEDWNPIGSKHALINLVEGVTGISARALLHWNLLEEFSVAQRLSWAAERETTREEDRAYSLLGIFDINMPTLYGEGDRAFRRLQEQIMQRIPDQSLFAWGEIYLSGSELPSDHNPTTFTPVPHEDHVRSPSANSPNAFEDSGNIQCVQLPGSLRHEMEYTFTPHGIRTQFQMIPLSCELLSVMFPHAEVELKLDDEPNSPWYLAILGCEHEEFPGHLLGRVCRIPSSDDGAQFVHTGYIEVESGSEDSDMVEPPELFPLSPEIIAQFCPQTELKTVYISHPQSHRPPLDPLWRLRLQPYTTIKLVLLMETCDALRSRRGYEADLCDPDPDHPTTHWLTLSNDEHMITVEFQHTLQFNGWDTTITAGVKMSGSGVQADHRTVSWIITGWPSGWPTMLDHKTVELSAAGAGTLTVGLGLDFAGNGIYFVRVDVQSDSQPASADVESVLSSRP